MAVELCVGEWSISKLIHSIGSPKFVSSTAMMKREAEGTVASKYLIRPLVVQSLLPSILTPEEQLYLRGE